MSEWINRFPVLSSDGTKTYTVAIDNHGNYGCDCPVWKFKRRECKHIAAVKKQFESETKELQLHPERKITREPIRDHDEQEAGTAGRKLTSLEKIKIEARWV